MLIKNKKYPGFTIVELLIVIVVIGILAAIVIVAYNGVTVKADNAAIQSDLGTMTNDLAIFAADNNRNPISHYELTTMNIKLTNNPKYGIIYCATPQGDDYALVAHQYGSTAGAAYIWKFDGSHNTSTTIFSSGYGSLLALCQSINVSYVVSDNSGNFANK